MDKFEYKVRSEEISKLIEKEKYADAVKIADTIDWRRVKSASMLLKIAALYRINRRNEDSREMLMLAYERYPTNRSVVYSLCELSIELDDVVAAIEYYKQFVKLAPKDNGVYTLRYRILEAQEASLEERIEILEELKKKDYQEEWGYELAYLYHRVGLSTKCVEECDDIILWFGDGPYVMKAMELKAKHVPLTDAQRKTYDIMLGNARKNYSGESDDVPNDSGEDYNSSNDSEEGYDTSNYGDEGCDTSNYGGESYEEQNYNTAGYEEQNYNAEGYDGQNYNAEGYDGQNYNDEGYDGQNYNAAGYDGQNYNAEGYDGQNYNDEGYDGQNYNAAGYDGQNYNAAGYDGQNYDAANYDAQGYDSSNYDGQDYGTGSYHAAEDENDYQQQGYEKEQYENEAYGSEAYADEGYGAENYTNEQYGTESYGQENYIEQQYTNGGYDQGQYADGNYGQNNFVDDGYGNLSYVDHSYSDNGYTEEFYVEQTYDENGNLIAPDLYSGSDYPQESYDYSQENFPDDNYAEPANAPKEYRNGLHLVENVPTPAANSSDMSQYNTINLQKVVAESMKELFPDDDDDVFAEDREKYNSAEDIGNITGSTRIFEGAANSNTAKKRLDKSALSDDHTSSMGTADSASENTHTGRVKIAQMVTGVLEAAPEPHTGAIRKVLVPGEDARLIKSDADLDALRDTTEQSVIDEHSRMEYNEENVYHEQSIMGMNETDETAKAQTTGPMKLDEVLIQWERMKQDNARKHQEEIKKRVLSQTGRIFVDFDNSIKSGILGELAREEEEARRNNQTSSTSKRDSSSKDGFLEADVTGDIPQQSASEDDFDVAYMTDHMPLTKEQESVAAGESEQRKPDVGANERKEPDNTADKEAMASTEESSEGKASTNKTADQETLAENAANTSIEKAYDETAALAQQTCDLGVAGSKVTEYTQKIPVEDIDILNYRAGDSAATEEVRAETYSDAADQYTEDVHSAKIDHHVGSSEYAEEHYVEDNDMHAKEAGDYTKERGINEAVGGYVDDYTKELSINEAVGGYADDYTKELGIDEPAGGYVDDYTKELGINEAVGGYVDDYTKELSINEAVGGYADDYTKELGIDEPAGGYVDDYTKELSINEAVGGYVDESYMEDSYDKLDNAYRRPSRLSGRKQYQYNERDLDPEDEASIVEMAKEDALKTQEIKMNTADLSSLSEKIVATTKKEARGAKREELREFTPEEQTLFENFAVTKKIKKQIIYALENMTLASYIGNVIITGDAGLDTIRMAKNLIKEYQASDESFSGKLAKITGEKINQRNIKDVFEKLNNGGIIIEKANGMSEEKLYEMSLCLTQENLGIVVIMEDTKKEITKLLEKQAMIVDYFNIRIDLMEMDNNALVAYAKNYALALEYSIDELGTLALYTRIANMQSGNHVVTKDEVRDIIDEAIWKSKKSKIKNFVDVLFARRYDNEDMIVLKERDFM